MANIDNRNEWAIEDIYSSESEWQKDYEKAESMLGFSEFEGKLAEADVFYACLKKQEEVGRIIEKLCVYAMMRHDVNTKDATGDELYARAMSLSVKFSSNTSFITPELLSLDDGVINGYIGDERFADYDYSLKCLLKEKEHVLSKEQEKLLADCGETFSSFKEIFTKIDNADIKFGSVKSTSGERVPLTHGTYGVILHGEDRELRKKAFKKYYKKYAELINTIASTYYGNVKKNVLVAKTRKHKSVLEMALLSEDVDEKVYKKLITSVEKALPTLHEYISYKKKCLGVDEFYMYDMYAPITKDAELKLEYDDAYQLVIDGLTPYLGEEYGALLKKAKDERWISVYETEGKRSGAYSVAVFDTHPYVLLNYQKTTHDVFTIAHELGHALHSYFSNGAQPYAKADYRIFVAEVASTVNEVLLIKHLIKTATDKDLKKYLSCYLMEMIRTTLFRQTQFSEFEFFAHGLVENGQPLNHKNLSEKYLELNKKYYGDAVNHGDEIKYEWARIPHFYRAFYVYKYATGIISALSIAQRIESEGERARADYFKFLSSGGSDSPTELLKLAGVDLTPDEPYERAFKIFEETLEELTTV